MNSESGPDDQILLKGSGRRSRLEITEDDLSDEVTTRLAAPAPALPVRGGAAAPEVVDEDVTIRLRRPRPLPGAGMVPPGGGPPDRYVHGAPTPWWRTRAATWTAAGLLALAVLAVVGILLLSSGKSSEEVVYAQLTDTHTAVSNVMDEASQASKLADLRAAGREADAALSSLDEPEATIRQLDDPQVTEPALRLVAAERVYLEALQGLAQVNRAMVTSSDLSAWKSQRRKIANAQQKVADAGDVMSGLQLPGSPEPVVLSDADLGSAAQAVNTTVLGAHDRWQAYKRRLHDYRAAVARADSKEAKIVQYRQQVRAALDAYAADRTKVDDYVSRARDFRSPTEAEASFGEIDGFVQDRQRTITELTNALALTPDEAVRAAHKNLQNPLSASLDGLQHLDDALRTWASDGIPLVEQEFSWGDFERASEDATQQLASTRGAWESAVQTAVKDVKDRGGIPKKPEAPKL